MVDDLSHQVKKVALAMGASLSDHDLESLPREMRLTGNFNYSKFLEYMRQFKTSEQQEELTKKAFQKLDKDGSGYIEWNEINGVFFLDVCRYMLSVVPSSAPVLPLSDEVAEALIQTADTDGDGRINFEEFSDMVKQEEKPKK
ncbi:parvalbumin-like EF-hand-containing protein isoform X2 [Hypomesus transpacificus]|uniref:parvalbumin-like EF-hand-containing protein isoform X2 n=1 Tax=Hypomesus transpacificus TaxID=137520 RepID=UPI001F07F8A1|nr:parvalbumin-like EF-hand-containing protein isoform X2 [Hypomesus transpacificus]